MTTITVPINKELESFINSELKAGKSESKAHLVRYALSRLREERALENLREAENDIVEGRVHKGNLKKLLSQMK
jgi:Arc/MetJ-type ribon-helix-helix transcriptional regulator